MYRQSAPPTVLAQRPTRRSRWGSVRALGTLAIFGTFSVGCGETETPSSANSFAQVYAQVIQPKCSNSFCHYNGASIRYSALDLSSKTRAYWSLVGLPSMGPACSQSGMRVAPWQPEVSVMYEKLSPSPPCGSQMPADSSAYSTNGTADLKFTGPELSAAEKQLIYDWIAEGAYNN
jgi:hypothetical protein